MKLLIITQAVDLDDPVLGFFHRWIESLAAHAEKIEVICLKEGRHALPGNVHVHSLGKPRFAKATHGVGARVRYILRFYGHLWRLHGAYDTVFVHMNEEYVLLAGDLWRLMGKRVVLWRNHAEGSWRTRLASILAHRVLYTSPTAFVARYPKAVQMPIGIDTAFFAPPHSSPLPHSALFLGRLDAVKKPELFVAALQELAKRGVSFTADLYGDPTDPSSSFARDVRARAAAVKGLALHGGMPHEKTLAAYQSHAIYVNLTPSGSFDKTIGEAMASGCLVVCANDAVKEVVPESCRAARGVESVANALSAALAMDTEERADVVGRQRAYIERAHSLEGLIERLRKELQ